MIRVLLVGVWGWLLLLVSAQAHVGNPFVVFEGRAGTYPVRVVVRQPEVVPGLAEINVRVLQGTPSSVQVLPIHYRTDRSGAPRPDVAELVAGETNLYTASLWLMTRGAYGIEVGVEGPGGGQVLVPVNSQAMARQPMPRGLALVLGVLGAGLVVGVFGIAVAAARESTLADGQRPGTRQTLRAVGAALVASLAVGGALYGGWIWWGNEDRHHVSRVLYRQTAHTVTIAPGDASQLRLELTDERQRDSAYRLIPDHGKLVHLFLVDAGTTQSIPAFAHLHPQAQGNRTFFATLPPLPAGTYRVFTELAHEAGFTQTLTNSVSLPEPKGGTDRRDPDDSWSASTEATEGMISLGAGLTLNLLPDRRVAGRETTLRVRVQQADGTPAPLEPFLRMLGHAVVQREEGSVFAHLHPSGNLSMAATRNFARKMDGDAGALAADVNCGDLSAVPPELARALGRDGEVSFPFVFPKPGRYFVWIQVKVGGQIRTAPLEVDVE
ncbi:MAG: hypothetical protein J0M24_15190 [Verrucomicrobia bacterium]|nr:hypothetical protein [Verrucomicrobiota bacterium]